MNIARPIERSMLRAALSLRAAKSELSAHEMRLIAQHAVTAHNALADIRKAAELAREQGGALDPATLIAWLEQNELSFTELEIPHGQEVTESSRSEPAGAAVP